MEGRRFRLKASHILPLITILQVPSASGRPWFGQHHQEAEAQADGDWRSELDSNGPWTAFTSRTGDWRPVATAYEISDGQVQVAYGLYTQEMFSASGSETLVGTTTITSWHTNHASEAWSTPLLSWSLPATLSTAAVSALPSYTTITVWSTANSPTTLTSSTSISSVTPSSIAVASAVPASSSTAIVSAIPAGPSSAVISDVISIANPSTSTSTSTSPPSAVISDVTSILSSSTSMSTNTSPSPSTSTSTSTTIPSSSTSTTSSSVTTVTVFSTLGVVGSASTPGSSLAGAISFSATGSLNTSTSPKSTSPGSSSLDTTATALQSSSASSTSSDLSTANATTVTATVRASPTSSASSVLSAAQESATSANTTLPVTLSFSTTTETYTTQLTTDFTTTIFGKVTSVPNSMLTSLSTSAVQTANSSKTSSLAGTAITSLETSGNPSVLPFPTSIMNATSTLSLVDTATLSNVEPTAAASVNSLDAPNIFQVIATNPPPSQISSRSDPPVPTLNIQPQSHRLETNKFYANFFLGDQTDGTWTHPYSVAWSAGSGESGSWGLAISHIERSQLVGPGTKEPWDAGDWDYFQNPIGLQSLVLSAAELGPNMTLTTDSLEAFSVNVNLVPKGASKPVLTFPLVQGMAFTTGLYDNGTPIVQSGIGILNVTYVGHISNGATYKYRAVLQDGFTWLIYVTPANSAYSANSFTLLTSGEIQGPSGFGGYIQIAKVPADTPDAESVYDASAGSYATAVAISGSVEGTAGTYTLSWTKEGVSDQSLLMFALPHHLSSFSSSTSEGVTDVQLVTTTKGQGTAVTGDSWTLEEPDLPVSMSFSPWSPELGDVSSVSAAAMTAINGAGTSELSQNISQQTNVGSLYYDGKALAKFAAIIYAVHDIADNRTLALTGLEMLESAFELHVNNEMTYPLVYDTVWGGAVSISTYLTGNEGDDFGNSVYNDHHFHYGYFVYAAAVIGYLDPDWLNRGTNKEWVNMLVRDYANSITDDPYFPFSRMFDWYHGHSWAHGLIATGDGKDQESSSEDTMASYGLKMWGHIIGDVNMEARGNLMLAIQARSLQDYYLYLNNNTVEPADFIGNKVAGILFENKIQHVTYFGTNDEYIEGIHMLPIMPFSTLTRTQEFVTQEWDTYFASDALDPAGNVTGGWRGILMANYAIIDPVRSYDFFSNKTGNFNIDYLDGGASQTWYLTWSAALGGSPS